MEKIFNRRNCWHSVLKINQKLKYSYSGPIGQTFIRKIKLSNYLSFGIKNSVA